MDGHLFRLFVEDYAKNKLAEYRGISPREVKHLTKENPIADYDLQFNGQRYDVKYANPTITSSDRKIPVWEFYLRKMRDGKRVNKNEKYCDFFICIGFLRGIPSRIFLIPFEKVKTRSIRISISGNSKYHDFEITTMWR
jgi:hypothetical protein